MNLKNSWKNILHHIKFKGKEVFYESVLYNLHCKVYNGNYQKLKKIFYPHSV